MSTPAVQRKLAAILAADVAGYSRLMGADEAGTARVFREHREAVQPVVTHHGGRIVKTTGDGVLLEFPSVVAAVECGIAVQKLMAGRNASIADEKRMLFRIGINLGDVLIEGDDILGDGVNIAARLESIAEPGGICLSGDAYRHVQGKIHATFVDMGEQDLKNIARPVRVYHVREGKSSAPPSRPELCLPDKPSIAVLAFSLLGGDPDDEAFADGLSEDIITALSRIKGLFVIARNSSFTYKGKAVDVRQIGRDLGVEYVMEGSVRRSRDRLRVTAQLIEATSGNHIWAEKYDRHIADVFDIQDDITERVTASTQTHIQLHEGARTEPTDRPDLNVWLLAKRSWARIYDLTPEALAEARALAERAAQLVPSSGLAQEVLAAALVNQVFTRSVPNPGPTLLAARAASEKAIRLQGSSEYAYWGLGATQFTLHEPDQAILTLQRGLQINPNCALIDALLGNYLALMGRSDEGIAATERSLRINPRDPINQSISNCTCPLTSGVSCDSNEG